jgi:Fe-Mn family superoxide dismutase
MKYLLLTTFLTTALTTFAQTPSIQATTPSTGQDIWQAKDYSKILGMDGISDKTLEMHFTLYKGYVKNTNLLYQKLKDYLTKGETKSPEYAELKRRFGWEFDGMMLHQLYFENLGGNGQIDKESSVYKKIIEDFGSYENWKQDFIATGAMRGIGWAILYQDPIENKLINTWIGEHDLGHLAGGKPILIMDVWEHAYLTDYGIDRAKYIDAFFKNIDFAPVQKRFAE